MKTLKKSENGWQGFLARQVIELIDGGNGIYLVTDTNSSHHKVFTYRTLKGAEKKFSKLDSLMVKK